MSDHPALQVVAEYGPVSGAAATIAAGAIGEALTLDDALRRTVEHFLGQPRVEIVTAALTRFTPDDPTAWIRLGGRAWVREWVAEGSTRTLLPPPGAGPEAALSMPWLSQLARDDHRRADGRPSSCRTRPRRTGTSSPGPGSAASSRRRSPRAARCSAACRWSAPRPATGPSSWSTTSGCSTRPSPPASSLEQSRRALAEAIDAGAEAQAGYQQFFGAVGHELRTPLAAITGYTEVLLDDAAQAPDGPSRRRCCATGR